MLQELNLQNN